MLRRNPVLRRRPMRPNYTWRNRQFALILLAGSASQQGLDCGPFGVPLGEAADDGDTARMACPKPQILDRLVIGIERFELPQLLGRRQHDRQLAARRGPVGQGVLHAAVRPQHDDREKAVSRGHAQAHRTLGKVKPADGRHHGGIGKGKGQFR